MEILDHTTRTARRRHKRGCFACGLPILPGDTYTDTRIAEGGRAWTSCTHSQCNDEMDNFDYDDDGWPERVLVDYEDWEELTPEWRKWYADRKKREEGEHQ